MGFWVGFNDSLDKQLDRGLKERIFNEEMVEKRRDRMLSLAGDRLKRRKTRENTAGQINAARQRLAQYGVSEDVLDRMEATGDADGMMKVVGDLEGAITGYKEAGRPVPQDLVNTYIEGAVMAPATVEEIDLGGIDLTEFGYTEEDVREMTTVVTPGAVSAEPPVVVEQPSLEDLSRVEKMAAGSAAEKAAIEANRIKSAIGTLDEAEGEANPADRAFLVERLNTIQNAMDLANSDNPSYAPLVGLYGAQYFTEIIQAYPQFSGSPFSPAFTENMGKQIPSVANTAQAYRLSKKYGALESGDIVFVEDVREYQRIP